MKYLFITVACILLCNCGGANAQGVIQQAAKDQSNASAAASVEKGRSLLEQYAANYRNDPHEGRNLLEGVAAYGLPMTAESVKAIRPLLASKVTADEKVVLARILGRLHSHDNGTGMNSAIENDLRNLANSGEPDVARSATLVYSRLGYFPDRGNLLLVAKQRGVIDTDTYFGELAHALPFAPPNDQLQLINMMRGSKNGYAGEITAMLVNSPEVSKKFNSEARTAIAAYLEEIEPKFTTWIGYYDEIDAIRYAAWLRAVSTLKGSDFNKNGNEIVMSRLNDQKIDPRKIMAYLGSEYGESLILSIGQRSRFEVALQRITLYSKQHPQNMQMKDAVERIKDMLNGLKT